MAPGRAIDRPPAAEPGPCIRPAHRPDESLPLRQPDRVRDVARAGVAAEHAFLAVEVLPGIDRDALGLRHAESGGVPWIELELECGANGTIGDDAVLREVLGAVQLAIAPDRG